MERASAAQAAGDTGAAAAAYREALTLDAGHEAARSSLAALQQRIATANYTARLSAGYAALAAGAGAGAGAGAAEVEPEPEVGRGVAVAPGVAVARFAVPVLRSAR